MDGCSCGYYPTAVEVRRRENVSALVAAERAAKVKQTRAVSIPDTRVKSILMTERDQS